MSLERAYRNCRFCYAELKRSGLSQFNLDHKESTLITENECAERAVNEAMKALEEEREYSTRHATGERTRRYKIAEDALQVCVRCNFESAGVAEFLERTLPDQFGKPSKEKPEEKK